MKRLVAVLLVWSSVLALALTSLLLPASSATAASSPGEPPAAAMTATTSALASLPSVSTGEAHSCAVTPAGGVKCWGRNSYGALGNGTTTSSAVPVDVLGLGAGVSAVSAGRELTCALTSAGAVKCWGENRFGGLGNGTTKDSAVPVDVVGLDSGVVAVSTGSYHACALTSAGAVKCWGWGQLGNGLYTGSAVPVDVLGLGSGAVGIAAGDQQSCAVAAGGAVKCWGYNGYGQLGDGTTNPSAVPVDVTGLGSGGASVTAGISHSCALTTAGAVRCWGQNLHGAAGGTTANSGVGCTDDPYECTVPVEVLGSGMSAVSASTYNSCALTATGTAKCWGNNWDGQLGAGSAVTQSRVPLDVASGRDRWVQISVGGYHSCAVTTAGAVKCWGNNSVGQLGNGTTARSAAAVHVIGLGSVPTMPTSVTATAGNAQAVVAWAAPSSDGGAAITGYTVTAAPGGLKATTTGATTATVTGLTNGTGYTFTVTAVNESGTSSESSASATVTPTAPGSGPAAPVTRLSDFTRDGRTDLVARDAVGRLWLYPGDGAGGFLARRQMGLGWNVMTALVTPGDVTGDGNADVLAKDSPGRLWLYPGNGAGGFSARRQIGQGWQSYTITNAANLNGTGGPDLLARDSAGGLWLYPLSGKAVFGTRSRVGTGWNGYLILGSGDFSGDGRADILARDVAGSLWLYGGNGAGRVANRALVSTGWRPMTALISAGNWDRAAGNDLLARDVAGGLWFYPGDSAGHSGPARRVGSGWQGMSYIG